MRMANSSTDFSGFEFVDFQFEMASAFQFSLEPSGSQSFISLVADLRQDINRVSSFNRCLNESFP